MNFSDLECHIGKVVDANDDKLLGRVRCAIPNIFDTRSTPVEKLPWIYPFSMGGYQRFSKMAKGSLVWVLHDKTSDGTWWYLPGFEKNDDLAEIIGKNENSEVLFARLDGSSPAAMYYDDVEGINQKIGDSNINLKSDGDLEINSNDTNITASGGEISLGSKTKATEPAALGNGVLEALQQIHATLEAMGREPNEQTISEEAGKGASELKNLISPDKIQAQSIKIN